MVEDADAMRNDFVVYFANEVRLPNSGLDARLVEFRSSANQLFGPFLKYGLPDGDKTVVRLRLIDHFDGLRITFKKTSSLPIASVLPAARTGGCDENDEATRPGTPSDDVAIAPHQSNTPLPVPKEYLDGWREILTAIGKTNNSSNKESVRRLNDNYEGPIPNLGQGKKPFVEKRELIDWWNKLEEMAEAKSKSALDKDATVEASHAYGREDEVVPEISGRVKKRRTDRRR
ncbi:MAG: hypothetical protein AAF670_11240 [Planctomycetota bacterium]